MRWYYPVAVALVLGALLTVTRAPSPRPVVTLESVDAGEWSSVAVSRGSVFLPVMDTASPTLSLEVTNCDDTPLMIDPQGQRLNGTTAPLFLASCWKTSVFLAYVTCFRAYIMWAGDQYVSMVEQVPFFESGCL